MGCFPCFGSSSGNKEKQEAKVSAVKEVNNKDSAKENSVPQSKHASRVNSDQLEARNGFNSTREREVAKLKAASVARVAAQNIAAQTFTFPELAAATDNFAQECLLGEGGFGRVYKGRLESTGQVVAVKQLDRNGLQGNREFLVEVLMLSLLHHQNLVNLIGYCAEGDQRLLVYELMPLGSLEDHLHDLTPDKEPLDWNTRMKIAAGAAKGLEYLHDKAEPPVIFRDLKSSNILLDHGFHPKLSDFGLAKLGPVGDKTHVSTRVMGTYGYCAPEYAMTGQLTLKSDVYSFGVLLLEIITGRKAIDSTGPPGEQNLVQWARPLFKDRKKFTTMVDPFLQGRYPVRGLYQALAVAAMCLQEHAATRPLIGDVVTALTYLSSQSHDRSAASAHGSSKVSLSIPRMRDDRRRVMADESDSPDNKGSQHHSPSSHRNSPNARKRDHLQEAGSGMKFGSSDPSGGSRRRLSEQPESRDIPRVTGRAWESYKNRDIDRERAVAEAKIWGENWREKKRAAAVGNLTGTNN